MGPEDTEGRWPGIHLDLKDELEVGDRAWVGRGPLGQGEGSTSCHLLVLSPVNTGLSLSHLMLSGYVLVGQREQEEDGEGRGQRWAEVGRGQA